MRPAIAAGHNFSYIRGMGPAWEQTRDAIDQGDLLRAYDIARSAVDDGDDSAELRHLLVLALARMGESASAMELFEEYRLDKSTNAHHRSLAARILKDMALATADPAAQREPMDAAYQAYADIFEESGDAYPGINAASLAILGGQGALGEKLAQLLLKLPAIVDPTNYYDAATRAEALLLLQDIDQAEEALELAASLPDANSGAKSSTYKQLSLISDKLELSDDRRKTLLDPVLPPAVIHYCGHMFLESDTVEQQLRDMIRQTLDREQVRYAYGSLAAGTDILVAEEILARGGELNVTLPFDRDDFIAQSVMPAGKGWLPRFERCLDAADSLHFATEMHYVGDPAQFGYASKVAMGMARLRGQYLGRRALQLAIWDGVESTGPAGTGADVAAWRRYGGTTSVIEPGAADRRLARPQESGEDQHVRKLAAYLFTDFPGFSKLPEAKLPAFWQEVMGRMADVLDRHGEKILARNSWGDAVLAIMPDAPAAAAVALALQQALEDFDYGILGLSESGGMRIGVHYGPAYETMDLVTGQTTFYGTEVSRAARIEPVTPPGAVFVTEPFAAILVLEAPDQFRCRYVGNVEFAKGYGSYPIYRLSAAKP